MLIFVNIMVCENAKDCLTDVFLLLASQELYGGTLGIM